MARLTEEYWRKDKDIQLSNVRGFSMLEKLPKLIKKTYRRIGITLIAAPEDEFVVGKAAYARGVRPKDMTATPYYR